MWVYGNLLLAESFIFWRKIACQWQRCKLQHFVTVRRFTYDVICQWPDLIWKWKYFVISGLNGVSVMLSFSSPSQTYRMLRLVNQGSIAQANATAFCKMSHNFWSVPMRTFKFHTRLGIIISYILILLLGQALKNIFWSAPQNMINMYSRSYFSRHLSFINIKTTLSLGNYYHSAMCCVWGLISVQ